MTMNPYREDASRRARESEDTIQRKLANTSPSDHPPLPDRSSRYTNWLIWVALALGCSSAAIFVGVVQAVFGDTLALAALIAPLVIFITAALVGALLFVRYRKFDREETSVMSGDEQLVRQSMNRTFLFSSLLMLFAGALVLFGANGLFLYGLWWIPTALALGGVITFVVLAASAYRRTNRIVAEQDSIAP